MASGPVRCWPGPHSLPLARTRERVFTTECTESTEFGGQDAFPIGKSPCRQPRLRRFFSARLYIQHFQHAQLVQPSFATYNVKLTTSPFMPLLQQDCFRPGSIARPLFTCLQLTLSCLKGALFCCKRFILSLLHDPAFSASTQRLWKVESPSPKKCRSAHSAERIGSFWRRRGLVQPLSPTSSVEPGTAREEFPLGEEGRASPYENPFSGIKIIGIVKNASPNSGANLCAEKREKRLRWSSLPTSQGEESRDPPSANAQIFLGGFVYRY